MKENIIKFRRNIIPMYYYRTRFFHLWSQVLGLFITEEDVIWFKTF